MQKCKLNEYTRFPSLGHLIIRCSWLTVTNLTENLYYDLLQDALMNIHEECNSSQLRLSSTCPQKHGGEVLRSQPTHRLLTPALTVVLTHNTNRGVQRATSAAAQRAAEGSV